MTDLWIVSLNANVTGHLCSVITTDPITGRRGLVLFGRAMRLSHDDRRGQTALVARMTVDS